MMSASPLKTILLVDDDDTLRGITEIALIRSGKGLTITAHASAAAAMYHLTNLGQDAPLPDLLLTDYIMPDMNGRDLILELHARNVKIPAILMTGKADLNLDKLLEDLPEEIIALGIITKPFQPRSLADQIIALWGAQTAAK